MQKYVKIVDLVKGFPTSIYLQRSASIQPRKSLSKLHVNSRLHVSLLYTTCNFPIACKQANIHVLNIRKASLHVTSRLSPQESGAGSKDAVNTLLIARTLYLVHHVGHPFELPKHLPTFISKFKEALGTKFKEGTTMSMQSA